MQPELSNMMKISNFVEVKSIDNQRGKASLTMKDINEPWFYTRTEQQQKDQEKSL